jgi:cell division protein FtsL
MTKLNFILLGFLLASALATVASTNHARKLFIALENHQAEQKRIEVEWGQLQLEQSTWAKHALVESLATKQLGMKAPEAARTQFVTAARVPGASGTSGTPGTPGALPAATSPELIK